ncbi:hypothetical protein I656_01799 [Geobacillus sp. WSUCF1]|nr:hypothetical protein I656_01799 [Geobacillus sp. WSUCF1]
MSLNPMHKLPHFRVAADKVKKTLLPTFRVSQNTMSEPSEAPSQEIRNPFHSPNAAAFAITKTNMGKMGKNDSSNVAAMPGSTPKERYCSSRERMLSSVNHCLIVSISMSIPHSNAVYIFILHVQAPNLNSSLGKTIFINLFS